MTLEEFFRGVWHSADTFSGLGGDLRKEVVRIVIINNSGSYE